MSTSAIADFVGEHSSTTETPYAITPWDSVVQDYEQKGYTEATFQNRHGNDWNVWTSAATRNTLIWSKTNNDGRGEGFNCKADARPNFWGSCTRYDPKFWSSEREGFGPDRQRNGHRPSFVNVSRH
jgi:outer membrane cobalamin receptor